MPVRLKDCSNANNKKLFQQKVSKAVLAAHSTHLFLFNNIDFCQKNCKSMWLERSESDGMILTDYIEHYL